MFSVSCRRAEVSTTQVTADPAQEAAATDQSDPTNPVLSLDAAKATGKGPHKNCGEPIWKDLSRKGNDATVSINSACASGASGWSGDGTAADPYAFAFDGVDDILGNESASGLPLRSAARTQMAWIMRYPGNVTKNVGGIIFQGTPTDNNGFSVGISNAMTLYISVYGNDLQSSETIQNGQWVHAAFTYDGAGSFTAATAKGYINGALTTQSDAYHSGGPVNTTGAGYSLGAPYNTTGYFFKGKIALLKMYDRALSAAEIKEHCQATASRFQGAACAP